MIVQHLDGEAVVAVGGLLTAVECLMLSKVLTWLGGSGGSKQEGCRGVGRMLCVSQARVTGHPCPVLSLSALAQLLCLPKLFWEGLPLCQVTV